MNSPQFEKRPCRPRDQLAAAGRMYPEAWSQVEEFREGRGKDLPDWPAWCFLPMAASYAIVSGGGDNRVSIDNVGDVARLAALIAWRYTQGVYRFDPAVYDAVASTPVAGDIPADVLYCLPEWCVYVETPGREAFGSPMHGFFAHLEWDTNTARSELRLLIDTDTALTPVPLHLGDWSLAEAISRMTDEASVQMMAQGGTTMPIAVRQPIREVAEPLVSLLLYLCSQNSEIGGDKPPANPEPKKTKRGWRLFPADRPTTWDVGVRLGAALRRAYHAAEVGDGTHAGPRAHVRRAHWHTYHTGAGRANTTLKWLPPIPVNVDDLGDLPAVVRPIK